MGHRERSEIETWGRVDLSENSIKRVEIDFTIDQGLEDCQMKIGGRVREIFKRPFHHLNPSHRVPLWIKFSQLLNCNRQRDHYRLSVLRPLL
jgi:hypothetical protein